jgi:hypothetical protein
MSIAFCIIDDIDTYANDEIKITIKNIFDFTISNLHTKGYKIFIGKNEDELLQSIKEFDHVVVMSPGTEYINGYEFFKALEDLVQKDFFVAGHILDRSNYDAYYELHHQCYVINMKYYNKLGCPKVGTLEKNVQHTQVEPSRASSTWHDDYTPKYVTKGEKNRTYNHRCHGWNLLRLAFENDLPVIVFDENIRNNKKHYYPESEKDFYKNKGYIDYKLTYCKEEFIHTTNTEWSTGIDDKYDQVVIPASGTLYLDLIEKGRVVFYDYNQRALDYWKKNCPRKDNVEYVFVHTDLLNDISLVDQLDPNLKTLVNLSNIFCYEGTAAKYSLSHRLLAQENLVYKLKETIKNIDINFSMKADEGHQHLTAKPLHSHT